MTMPLHVLGCAIALCALMGCSPRRADTAHRDPNDSVLALHRTHMAVYMCCCIAALPHEAQLQDQLRLALDDARLVPDLAAENVRMQDIAATIIDYARSSRADPAIAPQHAGLEIVACDSAIPGARYRWTICSYAARERAALALHLSDPPRESEFP